MRRNTVLRVLLLEWIVVTALLSLLLFAQSLFGKYGDDFGDYWEWLLNGSAPPLALLLSAAMSDDAKAWGQAKANMFRASCAFLISTMFLGALAATILFEPVATLGAFDILKASSYGMGIWLGIVFAAISAVLFDGR